jgi:glycosyltransferase involved in cell wall biosynthesis
MNTPLRIGLISYRSNPHCGGQGVYIRHLSRSLHEAGHRVEVIAGPPDPLLDSPVKLTRLNTLDLYNPEALFRTPKLEELSDPVNLMEWLDVCCMGYPEPWTFGLRVRRYLRGLEKRFDILHDNQSLSCSLIALKKTLPLTATIHHPITVDRRLSVNSTRSFFRKIQYLRWYSFVAMQIRVARRLPRIVTVSDTSRRDISREFAIPESRFVTIPNGIDTRAFHPLEQIPRIPGRIIVTTSADTPLKGLSVLLQGIRNRLISGQASLVVVGTPQKNGQIERLIRYLDLTDHIQFTGRIDPDRYVQEYARATLAVVPSLYEGFGLPVGEAMACRVPVVATTGGALPEVAGDAALLVPPGDSHALDRAVGALLEDERLRESFAEKGYQRIRSEFTWEKTAQKTVQTYREIIRAHH